MAKKRSKQRQVDEDGYEFSSSENAIIGAVGARARLWGLISLALGAIVGLLGVLVMTGWHGAGVATGTPLVLLAFPPLVTGKAYLDAGVSMEAVVRTDGSDMKHMMTAVTKITRAARIEAVTLVIALVAALVLGVVASRGGS